MGLEAARIPNGWANTSLEAVCQILDSRRIPLNSSERSRRIAGKAADDLYPYYGATGQVGVIDDFIFDGEHILLGEDGAPFLDPFKVKSYLAGGKFWVNNHAHILKSTISNRYLCHYLNQIDYSDHVTGTTRLKLTQNALKRIPVLVAPTDEQRRIVAKIDELFSELDKSIESLKTARAKLNVYRQAVLMHAFEGKLTTQWREENKDKLEKPEQLLARIKKERDGRYEAALDDYQKSLDDWRGGTEKGRKPAKPRRLHHVAPLEHRETEKLPSLPPEWAFSRMGLYIDQIEAGKSFQCLETEPSADQVGVAKVSAVTWGEYDEAESKTCLDADMINRDLFIREGDFLLSRANTIQLVGASVVAKTVTKRIMLSDKTLRIHFTPEDHRFFLYYLRSPYGRTEVEARSTGNQESMRNIGQDRIMSIILPVCTEVEQAQIVRILDTRLETAETLEAEIDAALTRAHALRLLILKKAFAGQLVAQDPHDEPACVLLDRIRAEREKAKKNNRSTKTKKKKTTA